MTKSIKEKTRLSNIEGALNTDANITVDMLKVNFKFNFLYYQLSSDRNHAGRGKVTKVKSSKTRKTHHQLFNKIILEKIRQECYKLLLDSAKTLKTFDYNIVVNYTYQNYEKKEKREEGYIIFDISVFNKSRFIGKVVMPKHNFFTVILDKSPKKDIENSLTVFKNSFKELKIDLSLGSWLSSQVLLKEINSLSMMKKIIPFAYHKKNKPEYGKIPVNLYNILNEKSIKLFMNNCSLFKILFFFNKTKINVVFEYKHKKSKFVEHTFNNALEFDTLSVLNVLRINNSLGFDMEDKITEENVEEVKNLLFLYNY